MNKDLNGAVFRCQRCGVVIDRQLNAAINLYLKMEGLSPHPTTFFRSVVRPLLHSSRRWRRHPQEEKWSMKKRRRESVKVGSGFTLTGAEWRAADELARPPHDTVKPQLYVIL